MRLAVDVERAVLVVVSVDGFSRRQTASLTNERSGGTDGLTISALLTCQGGQRRPRRCCDELGMKGIHAGAEWVGDKNVRLIISDNGKDPVHSRSGDRGNPGSRLENPRPQLTVLIFCSRWQHHSLIVSSRSYLHLIAIQDLARPHANASMATPSHLNGPAFQASRAALSAALADTQSLAESPTKEDEIEQGEIQEVDMQAQAETIRTVFSDPTNFNVKVSMLPF
jgi:hypothetical protein